MSMKTVNVACKAVGHLVAVAWGKSPDRGTPYAALAFRIDDGEFTGAVVRGRKHFTDKTVDQVEETFLAMGWDGTSDFTDPVAVPIASLKRQVILDIAIEEWDDRQSGERRSAPVVNFVNPLVRVDDPMAKEEASNTFQSFMRRRGVERAGGRPNGYGGPRSASADDFQEAP